MTLLRAMRDVTASKLLLVGEGPQRADLESFTSENRLQNVKFLGHREGEELKSLVAHSKFVVVPSEWYDNSPLVIYESFALGKPVIGAAIGGIPELVEHEKTGLIFKPGDEKTLSEKINFLLSHPELIKVYGMNARARAEKEFSPRFHYRRMVGLYRQLLGSSQGGGANDA